MRLKINATEVFDKTWNALNNNDLRYIISQGGSRSSKTYSICQCLILYCRTKKVKISIVRQTFPTLRASVMKDFFEILNDLGLYNEKNHNKTENYYQFTNGSIVEFFSTDTSQKIRGRKRDILYCNEANELSEEVIGQLLLRTSGKVLIDFNPSDTEHWIYNLLNNEKSILIKSTYKDNPFLTEDQVEYIEGLINADENFYRVYVLGERQIATTRIYTHFKQYIDEPQYSDWCYGLDFGYTHDTALVKVMYVGSKIYTKEILYVKKKTGNDLVELLKEYIFDNKPIYCDYSRPEIIEELRRNKFNVKSAIKDVKPGINSVKSNEIYVHHESINLLREFKLYSWKSKGDLVYDEPIKLFDDCLDALRYAIHTNKKSSPTNKLLKFY